MHTYCTSWLLLMLDFGGRFCYLLNLVFLKCFSLLKIDPVARLRWMQLKSRRSWRCSLCPGLLGLVTCVTCFRIPLSPHRAAEGVRAVMLLLGPSGKCLFMELAGSPGRRLSVWSDPEVPLSHTALLCPPCAP